MAATGFGVGAGQGDVVFEALSNSISRQSRARSEGRRSQFYDEEEDEEEHISKADEWKLMPEVKLMNNQREQDGKKPRRLGVTWNNLTVKGVAADAAIHENIFSQLNLPLLIREATHKDPLKTILDQTHGCVKPGEMLLVLGRPGSGCTSLLKMIANHRQGYAAVEGDVFFGSMNHKEAGQYRGQIVMNTEDELFFPTLTVGQTIDFATRMKVPYNLPSNTETSAQLQVETRDFLLRSMGIDHTYDTKVGNEYVRGVSGGERKRVSIIECLATRGSVFCWDNSTRGLDASTALEYTKAVRAMTDILGLSSIVTLYQAGNGIFDLFDKVLVLDEGKEIYYGPMDKARPFMEDLGFVCQDSANVADFLTGVTVPVERRIKPGYEDRFPRTADDIRTQYNKSPIKALMDKESDYASTEVAATDTKNFQEAVHHDQHKSLSAKSPLTTSFAVQVKACVIRQYQIIWGDKATFAIKQVSTLIQALIAGSLFYNAPPNSAGLFLKGGTLFFSLLYHSLVAMSEVIDSFTGRPILAKHKSFAFFHPAAFCIAQIAADIPVLLFQISHFGIVIYFMAGLKVDAGAFFTYWIVCFAVVMCITAMFRAIGAAFTTFDAASKVSGFVFTALVLYAGYQIPRPQMHPWFGWIYWLNPLAYGFQSLLANEFHNQIVPCVGGNLIPSGKTYNDTNFQSCAGVPGAVQGQTTLTGDQYLHAMAYSHSHVWRNFGIVWAWWALFVFITIVFTMRWSSASGNTNALLIPREQSHRHAAAEDEESQEKRLDPLNKKEVPGSSDSNTATIDNQLVRNTSIFTWKNLTYTVKTPSGDRILLDNVHGWVKPGMLGALMGSSGAGKTTLLDVLAQRKTDGTIHGSIMVDGRPLSLSFQRSAGYCEQLDVHEPMATVREALEFSALLRQSRTTPKEEKIAYVDTIIDLLELHDIEHTLIGKVGLGPGLSIEQKKRLTIGVELVSKPSILIFLDEPTSGLDGQAAFNTIRFLRKLADVGQAVLVTIHQPSASLFAQFDTLLLLARGGKTVYFGEIGDEAATLKAYFAKHGALIDVVSGNIPEAQHDWNKVWLESPEHQSTVTELDQIIATAAAAEPGMKDDGYEFATTLLTQVKLVTHRMNVSLYRNTDYVNNKIALHVGLALFTGFSFWKIGDSVADLQLRMFAVFNFIFVAPGVINQLQPLFIERRDIYETREKKSKMYDWKAFVTGLIISEFPYLCVCAVLYFACWYYTVGFPTDSNKSGAVFFVMLFYEFSYTGMGQFIAAYAPNAVFASLVNPLILGTLISFCGVLVPYAELQVFWKYWMYYLNPYNYLMGSILTFTVWDAKVKCRESEYALFDTPLGQSCQSYLTDYMNSTTGSRIFLSNPDATSGCKVCQYTHGKDYLATLNLTHYFDGWRDSAINVIFVISSYALVYLMMKLRTKAAKKAE